MDFFYLLVLATLALVMGEGCKEKQVECNTCIAKKNCSFLIRKDGVICEVTTKKVRGVRFKATKPSQCTTAQFILDSEQPPKQKEDEPIVSPVQTKQEKNSPNQSTTVINNSSGQPAASSVPMKIDEDSFKKQAPPFQQGREDADVSRDDEIKSQEKTGLSNISAAEGFFEKKKLEQEPTQTKNSSTLFERKEKNDHDHHVKQTTQSPPTRAADDEQVGNSGGKQLMFQYSNLTDYDCQKGKRLMKRIENSLCTSWRLLRRWEQKYSSSSLNPSITGVEFHEDICSFLKAEKLYCKAAAVMT